MRTVLALLLLCLPSWGQELTIKGGDAKVIQRDKIVTVKEDIILVRSMPFTVDAPSGGFGYVWQVPSGVKSVRKKNVLEVTEAAKGAVTIAVEWYVVDFTAKTITDKSASITFLIGEDSPPKPPVDPVPPVGVVKHLSFVGPNVDTAGTVADTGLRDYLKSSGVTVHVLSANDPNIDASKLRPAVNKAGGVPCVVLQAADGSVLDQAKITTVAEVKTLVGKYLK